MASSIIKDPSIRYINNITWSKVSDLQEIPDILLSDGLSFYIPKENQRRFKDDDVINLSDRLHSLQEDLDRYNPSLIQRIINFFTGKMFTICRLRNCLSDIVTNVSRVAKRILDKKTKEMKEQKRIAEQKAREDEERMVAEQKAEEQKQAKLKLLSNATQLTKKALSLAPKANQVPSAANLIAFQDSAREVFKAYEKMEAPNEEAIAKGEEIRVNESNLQISDDDLHYKLTLVGRAKKIVDHYASTFTAKTETPDYSLQTVTKVQKYIRTLFVKLALNKNVPLPRWYHSTGRNHYWKFEVVEKIIKGGFIHQTEPRNGYGYGAYFSSRDEHEIYGPQTFVIDEDAFSDKALNPTNLGKEPNIHYFFHNTGRADKPVLSKRDRYNQPLWLRVSNLTSSMKNYGMGLVPMDCVPINPHTVAFMASPDAPSLREKLREWKCNISAIEREDADFIRLVFDAAESQKTITKITKYEKAQEEIEKQTKQQADLVKYRDGGKLIAKGGRYIPPNWQPLHSNSSTFAKNLFHLSYLGTYGNTKKLEVTRGKIPLAEVIEGITENYN